MELWNRKQERLKEAGSLQVVFISSSLAVTCTFVHVIVVDNFRQFLKFDRWWLFKKEICNLEKKYNVYECNNCVYTCNACF